MRLIDADALMNDICESLNQMTNIGIAVDGEWLWGKLNDALDNAPTIEPQMMRGKWIHDGCDIPHGVDWMHCSVCGRREPHVPAAMTNYCPNCGADMREE